MSSNADLGTAALATETLPATLDEARRRYKELTAKFKAAYRNFRELLDQQPIGRETKYAIESAVGDLLDIGDECNGYLVDFSIEAAEGARTTLFQVANDRDQQRDELRRYRAGPATRKARISERHTVLDQLVSNGTTNENQLYECLREQYTHLLWKDARRNLSGQKQVMRRFREHQNRRP
jgi:hypothetical protein